jgi:aminoglycoside phosphotransferase (APT) family kinase protein
LVHPSDGYDPSALPAPHGYELPPERRRLLRSRPPAVALQWAAAAYGPTARVLHARPLPGGTSSAIHVVTVDDGRGGRHRAVLRRYVRPDVMDEASDGVATEAAALRLLAASSVPAPRLLAADPGGQAAGVPAVLMSLLPGRIQWAPAPSRLDAYLRRLAEPLLAIDEVAVPAGTPIPAYRPYELGRPLGPPPWSRLPRRVWDAAVALYEGPPPQPDRRFIHRDYHPGNVLWRRGAVSGVVDWQHARLGALEADVGHCRANLHRHFSAAVADRFLRVWQAISGRTEYHPYWDVTVVLTVPGSYGPPDERLDEFVAAAVARL